MKTDFGIGKDLKYKVSTQLAKPERVHRKTYKIPSDIVKPSIQTMEPVYTDGNFLYKVSPFMFQENQIGYMMVCTSFMYYGVAVYDKDTGRFLKSLYSHTDKDDVQQKFFQYMEQIKCTKIDNPYVLYDLRITHGYYY